MPSSLQYFDEAPFLSIVRMQNRDCDVIDKGRWMPHNRDTPSDMLMEWNDQNNPEWRNNNLALFYPGDGPVEKQIQWSYTRDRFA